MQYNAVLSKVAALETVIAFQDKKMDLMKSQINGLHKRVERLTLRCGTSSTSSTSVHRSSSVPTNMKQKPLYIVRVAPPIYGYENAESGENDGYALATNPL